MLIVDIQNKNYTIITHGCSPSQTDTQQVFYSQVSDAMYFSYTWPFSIKRYLFIHDHHSLLLEDRDVVLCKQFLVQKTVTVRYISFQFDANTSQKWTFVAWQ